MKISSPTPSCSSITPFAQGTQTSAPHSSEIMQASSAVLTQATDTLNRQSDYSVQTTHSSVQKIQGLFNELAAKKASNPSMRVALVSGGSVSGYATALKLKNLGFEVIVSEKRSAYTRENSFILKKEAFFSLANLSPDGSLLRSLLQEQLLDVHTTNIVKKDDARSPLDLVAKPNTAARFIAWFSNKQDLRAGALLVPKKVANHQAEAGHLDLAWPNQEPLQSVKAQDWRYDDLSSMGSENLGLAQFRNLEKGLNAHCVKQAGIHVLNAEVSVQKMQGDVPRYAPSFGVSDADQALQPQFPFDLICIAEGANSSNMAVLGEPTVIPQVESWYQANFAVPNAGRHGFFGSVVDAANKQITAVQHMERPDQALINVSLGVPPDQVFDEAAIATALKNASHLCKTAGLPVDLSTMEKEFEAKRIDVNLKRAAKPIDGNLIVIGDAAGSGSPAGAFGGSLALSAYPEAVERLVSHPDFNHPEKHKAAQRVFEAGVAQIVKIRHHEPSKIMNSLGFYAPGVYQQQLNNANQALSNTLKDS